MEPRGPANHTATAMDPVHGLQSGLGQAEFTQTTQRGAVLRSGYGSEGTGEVSRGMGSTTFTGHQSQPQDVARQPFPVFDSALSGVSAPSGGLGRASALSGVSALPGVSALSGVPAFSGQSIHSVAVHGDTPMEVEMGSALAGPLGPPGYAGLQELFSSGYFSPVRGPAFSLGSQATPGIHRHPYGVRGIFRVGANASHQAGTAPPLWWD